MEEYLNCAFTKTQKWYKYPVIQHLTQIWQKNPKQTLLKTLHCRVSLTEGFFDSTVIPACAPLNEAQWFPSLLYSFSAKDSENSSARTEGMLRSNEIL